MRELQIDRSVLPEIQTDQITQLCWTSRELLGAYMEEGLVPEDWADVPADKDLGLEGGKDGIVLHETATVLINENQAAYLSNIPHTYDVNMYRRNLTEPGYVALRDLIVGEDPALEHCVDDEDSFQLIFRMPMPGVHGAAIFEGWSLDAKDEITAGHTKKLVQIGEVLEVVRFALRTQVELDPHACQALYHSHVPRESTGLMVEAGLRDLLGE